ncbi:helix-turn-helix domain-containing protein [Vibrio sp. PP-XX7]
MAQDLVMFLRRPGGQSQFSRHLLNQARAPGPIRDLQSWIIEHLTCDLSVNKLAERVAMSPRNFTRVFTRETGISPAKYVEEVRPANAATEQRLEQSAEGIEQIAMVTGFSSSLNFGAGSSKETCTSPQRLTANAFTLAAWRKLILLCHLRHMTAALH